MFPTKVAYKIKTQTLCSTKIFFSNIVPFINVEKYGRSRQATDDNIEHGHCMLVPKATNTHSQHITVSAFPLQQWCTKRGLV